MSRGRRTRTRAGRLPPVVWMLQGGLLVNYLGLGFVLPFELIYLHTVRGFSLPIAGLISATLTGTAVVGGMVAGPAIDRLGARTSILLSLLTLGIGWSGLAFITRPWQGFTCAVVAGLGNGWFLPSQSSLILQIVPRELRHRAAAVSRVVVNIGIGAGGALGGLIASTGRPATFSALFLINAATYLGYAAVLLRLPIPRGGSERTRSPGGYVEALRRRPLLSLVLANVLFTSIGYGVLASLVPVFARDHDAIGEQVIGLLFTVNSLVVILAQLPIARLVEGRRRLGALALMSSVWGLALLFVSAGTLWLSGTRTAVALALAAAAFGIGECLHAITLTPLIADLVPPDLLGRAMALVGTSWWVGLAITPALGGFMLGVSAAATWTTALSISFALALVMLALEPSVPAALRLTPRADGSPSPDDTPPGGALPIGEGG